LNVSFFHEENNIVLISDYICTIIIQQYNVCTIEKSAFIIISELKYV